ncbi:hypothetical protein P4N68_11210 [Corynebacterium felinum]|uniref:Uncharacterized protein n=1 Tax=Corynebacterium felinum TaxID=131318 RepID=A0ABU2B7T9_9CORY|nr:hypothetical protein [Corynebacterium felinum]MDF5821643.1 hypothetical protein [Corynebacterium felinum]MDR7354676.1 hypothetical protein [Corynebacterium felinum]WJY94040.1 hypothetical protein CFELI_01990 [Corynebacterium felinum]
MSHVLPRNHKRDLARKVATRRKVATKKDRREKFYKIALKDALLSDGSLEYEIGVLLKNLSKSSDRHNLLAKLRLVSSGGEGEWSPTKNQIKAAQLLIKRVAEGKSTEEITPEIRYIAQFGQTPSLKS